MNYRFSVYVFCVLFFFPFKYAVSQNIKGKIVNTDGNYVEVGSVSVKTDPDDNIIREYTLIKNGEYNISLKNSYDSLWLEISGQGYKNKLFKLKNVSSKPVHEIDFEMESASSVILDEVILKAKKSAFKITGDTISFNVDSYKDGSERKVEDLLKKLPGIEVNEKTGKIKYRGKSVETVKIEGDDLFGSNYMLGTKNINIDIVEKIEAIENYNENPLLKNIEHSDKVALNLKIKENKINFSGDASIGLGYGEDVVKDISVNLLSISKKYKSFITASNNNIGLNKSPVNYFSSDVNNDNKYKTQKAVNETTFSSILGEDRSNLNDMYFGSYNSVFKINKATTVKTNLFYVKDNITSYNIIDSEFNLENETIKNSDKYYTSKKPQLFSFDVDLKYNSSANSLLEYFFKYNGEKIGTKSEMLFNNDNLYNTNLKTNDNFIKNTLLFTKRISDNKAVQLESNFSLNKIPQNYFLSPPPVFIQDFASHGFQFSEFSNNIFNVKTSFLGRSKKHKYSVVVGYAQNNTRFNSFFKAEDFEAEDYHNDLKYRKSEFYLFSDYNFILGNLTLSPSVMFNSLNQKLEDFTAETNNHDFLKNSNFQINYKLNNISNLSFVLAYNENPIGENYLYYNKLLTGYRSFQSNNPDLAIQETTRFQFSYRLNDLYNQFQFFLTSNYSYIKNNFFSENIITDNFYGINFFFSEEDAINKNIFLFTEKHIPKILLTAKLKTNYGVLKYKNFVNNSEVRDNKSRFLSNDIILKTTFDNPFNIENSFRFNINKFETNNERSSQNIALTESLKLIYKFKDRYFAQVSSDYHIPNVDNKNDNYLFLDATLRYISKSKRFELDCVVKNILNNNKFIQVYNSDFSVITFQNRLIPRYLLIYLVFNF